MMTRTNYDHILSYPVTRGHIEATDGAFGELSQSLSEAFRLIEIAGAARRCGTDTEAELRTLRERVGTHTGQLAKAMNLTWDALNEVCCALQGLARLSDLAGHETNIAAADMAALITPHIRTLSDAREMLQGAAR